MDQSHTLYATFVPSEVPSYTLTTSTTGSGSVSGAGLYKQNQQATLQTYPELGYVFDRWRGHASGDDNPLTITMDADKSVEAVFVRDGGTSTIGPNRIALRSEPLLATAETSDVVTLRATVTNSSGGRVPDGTPVTIVSQNESVIVGLHRGALTTRNGEVSARFVVVSLGQVVILTTVPGTNSFRVDTVIVGEQARYQVQATPSPLHGGRIDGTGAYTTGDRVRLQAIANDGFRFVRWEGARSNTQNPLSLPVTRDMSFRAVFERDSYLLTASAEPADSISGFVEISGGTFVRPGQKRFDAGERALINARSNPGWEFVGWFGDVTDRQAPAQSILMDRDKSVIARWQLTGPRFSSPVSNQTWGVGTPIAPLVLPIARGGAGGFSYSIKHEWDGVQVQTMPQGLTFNSRTRTITGTPRDLRPHLRRFTVFYKAEDRFGAYDELSFVVTLQPPLTASPPTTTGTLEARIEVRSRANGQYEAALNLRNGDHIGSGRFASQSNPGRWHDLANSPVTHSGATLGHIRYGTFSNRLMFAWRPDGGRTKLVSRKSGCTAGWGWCSEWFEISTSPKNPELPRREVGLAGQGHQPPQHKHTLNIEPTKGPSDAPFNTATITLRARYHQNNNTNAEIEIRLLGHRGDELTSLYVMQSELLAQAGAWVWSGSCTPVPNWNCVLPAVRFSQGRYEFAVRHLAAQQYELIKNASFTRSDFERDRNVFHNWKTTAEHTIPSIRNHILHDLGETVDTPETAARALYRSQTQYAQKYNFESPSVQAQRRDLEQILSSFRDLKRGDDLIAKFFEYSFKYVGVLEIVGAAAVGNWLGVAYGVSIELAKANVSEDVIREIENKEDAEEVARALVAVLRTIEPLLRHLEAIKESVERWGELHGGSSLRRDEAKEIRMAAEALSKFDSIIEYYETAVGTLEDLKTFAEFRTFSIRLLSDYKLTTIGTPEWQCVTRFEPEKDECLKLLEDSGVGLKYYGNALSDDASEAVKRLQIQVNRLNGRR